MLGGKLTLDIMFLICSYTPMQSQPHPEPLTDILLLIIRRTGALVRAVLDANTPAAAARIYARLRTIVFLSARLALRLPDLAETFARRTPRPNQSPTQSTEPGGPDHPERPERPERPESLDRPDSIAPKAPSVPALVARICREITKLAAALGQEARDELLALAAQAKAAATPWRKTQPPKTPTTTTPAQTQPNQPTRHHWHQTEPLPALSPAPQNPKITIRGQGSG